MKDRPILFSGPMVRAILDGRKTQTRRPVKPHDLRGSGQPGEVLNILGLGMLTEASLWCPLGQPGDRLWVRETWRREHGTPVEYRATTSALMEYIAPWRPSIHMPRWASRITLEITRVLVERVQDITEEDSEAEGVDLRRLCGCQDGCGACDDRTPKQVFADLWKSIYGTWEANPWVWAVEFRRTK